MKPTTLTGTQVFARLKVQFAMANGMQCHYSFMQATKHAIHAGAKIWIDHEGNEHQDIEAELDEFASKKLLKLLFPDFNEKQMAKWTKVRDEESEAEK